MTTEQLKRGQEIQETLENLRTADTYLSKEHPDVQSDYWVSITSGRTHKTIQDEGLKLKVREYLKERIRELEEEFADL